MSKAETRELALNRISRFTVDYADLIRKADRLDPLGAEFGRLYDEEDMLIRELASDLDAYGNGSCRLEETASYPSERGTVHVLECSECGQECEHVNGDYEHCPHCMARNELF